MFGGFPCRYNPYRGAIFLFYNCMDDDQQCAILRLTHGDPTFLVLAVHIVKDGYLLHIQKHLGSLLKAHAMLTGIGLGLVGVPLEIILHLACLSC